MAVLHHKARSWDRIGILAPLCALSVLSACGTPAPAKPKAKKTVRIQAFAESTPIHDLIATPNYAYVASAQGIDRWDLKSREVLRLSQTDGLPSSEVYSLAYDEELEQLWIATAGGITRYKSSRSTFFELPAPGAVFGIEGYQDSVMTPAEQGGLWIGLRNGLFYSDAKGKWSTTGIESRVTALLRDAQGALWIGTESGITWVDDKRVAHSLGAGEGCDFTKVVALTAYGSGILVVAESGEPGKTRVALAGHQGCVTYKVPENKTWVAAIRHADETYVLGTRELYRVGVPVVQEGESPVPPGITLPASTKSREVIGPAALRFEEVEQPVPRRASHLAGSPEFLLLGTAHLGTMIWKPGDISADWLRIGELTRDASTLTVACVAKNDCFVATGTSKLWRWKGSSFVNEGDLRRVHAVLSLKDGRVVALRDAAGAGNTGRAALVLALYEDGSWNEISGIRVETPGKEVRVSAAREAPGGLVWLAISYVQGRRRTVPYGVAAVDLDLGMVIYHRASFDKRLGRLGVLPVPVDVTGIAFLEEEAIWFSSSQGATRVVGEEVKTFIEADGLRSELLRGVVCTPGGMVYTASSRGLGAWDGESWTFPPELRSAINDLTMGEGGRLWLATDRGLGVYDGARVRRLDTRRGLLENKLLDVESDNFGRIWVMSESGLVLVDP